jgi:hypothetical protein
VLAADESERLEHVEHLLAVIVNAEYAKASAKLATERLALLARPGDVAAFTGGDPLAGWSARVDPPATPARQVKPHALDEHAEALDPIGLAPIDVPKVERVYPGVGDLTSKAAKDALTRAGLSPEVFIHTPTPGPPRIVVVPPE